MASIRGEEIIEVLNEKVYVAVSKEVKACKSILVWALQNSGGRRVCLVHVHQPAQTMSVLGGRYPISSLSEQVVIAHWEKERKDMCKILNEYLLICAKAGVQADKLYVEMNTIESGILELISQHKIERLVMGAAADNRYSRKMMEPKSKKANYVRQHAPDFSQIWFICKGHLIYTREGTRQSCLSVQNENQLATAKSRMTQSTSGWSTPINRADSFDDLDQSSTFSLSPLSGALRTSVVAANSNSTPPSGTEERQPSSRSLALPPKPNEKQDNSPSPSVLEVSVNFALYDQLDQAVAEVETAKHEAFQESVKRHKAEKEAIEAIRKAKALESLYFEELRRRKEIQDDLAKAREELENTKKQRNMAKEQLRVALDQNLMLETRVHKSHSMGKELENEMVSALELLQNYKKL